MIRILGLSSGCLAALLLLYVAASAPAPGVASAEVAASPAAEKAVMVPADDIAGSPPVDTPAPPAPAATDHLAVDKAPPIETATVAGAPPVETDWFDEPEEASPPERAAEVRWYSFWSPFRTAVAANGFVAELQRTTGLDYRVTRRAPGEFEVAFAYEDDADAARKLALIAEASGIDAAAR